MAFDLDDEENKATRIANGASKERKDENMDIEVGEYVRTKDGIIAQIKSIDYEADIYRFDRIIYINDFEMKNDVLYNNEMFKKVIARHSKELIDLIDKDDYVNGYKVIKLKDGFANGTMEIVLSNNTIIYRHHSEDIETILTKENYMANCYKVGGEDENRRTNKE